MCICSVWSVFTDNKKLWVLAFSKVQSEHLYGTALMRQQVGPSNFTVKRQCKNVCNEKQFCCAPPARCELSRRTANSTKGMSAQATENSLACACLHYEQTESSLITKEALHHCLPKYKTNMLMSGLTRDYTAHIQNGCALAGVTSFIENESCHSNVYKITLSHWRGFDQPKHPHSLIRLSFALRLVG